MTQRELNRILAVGLADALLIAILVCFAFINRNDAARPATTTSRGCGCADRRRRPRRHALPYASEPNGFRVDDPSI